MCQIVWPSMTIQSYPVTISLHFFIINSPFWIKNFNAGAKSWDTPPAEPCDYFRASLVLITANGDMRTVREMSELDAVHSALMRNLTKVWKTFTLPLQRIRVWSRVPKSALSEILQNKEYNTFPYFEANFIVKLWLS